ncbi:MAG: diguanylate cyclase [Pseudomonadota bacterium]|nr:diguanylate cyclase [Pseudomonadota bacterium]
MTHFDASKELLEFIVDRVNIGVFILNQDHKVLLWNSFMASNSGKSAEEVVGQNLFQCFPDLPERWFARKVNSVFMLKNFAFTSWEQRAYLFPFRHNRPVTGGMDYMCQDMTLMPIKDADGAVESVCIVLFDSTDTAIYRNMHQAAMQKLEMASRVDGLTQLFNRAHWQSRLVEEFSRASRYKHSMSLLLFDLDHFKSINDKYGHLGGDAVLVRVAQLVLESLRESDVAGRYGGEEFGIILPNTDGDGAMVVAERLRRSIEASPVPFENLTIAMSASIGVVEFCSDFADAEQMISKADEALYRAKEMGRNRVVQAS